MASIRMADNEFRRLSHIEELYMELLYAVEKKHPSENRHATALRYIRERESVGSTLAGCSAGRNDRTEA